MQEISIPRTGQSGLSFVGELLGEGSTVDNGTTTTTNPNTSLRTTNFHEPRPGFVARLYRTQGGQFVPFLSWSGDHLGGGFAEHWTEPQGDLSKALAWIENVDVLDFGVVRALTKQLFIEQRTQSPFSAPSEKAMEVLRGIGDIVAAHKEATARLRRALETERIK
jgi:hypothetical protein